MIESDQVTRELRDLRAYAELAIYHVAMRGDPDLSAADLRDMLTVLRDVLSDVPLTAETNGEVQIAYDAARRRGAMIGRDVSRWPESSPWGLQGLIEAANALIAELDLILPRPPVAQRALKQRNPPNVRMAPARRRIRRRRQERAL